MYYPRHAGFSLGEMDSPKYVVVETHYDNQLNSSGTFFSFSALRNFAVLWRILLGEISLEV